MTETIRPQVEKARRVDLSVVLPAYNEAACLEQVHAELKTVLEAMKATWEIIFVDDGSTDGTREILRRICGSDTRAVILGRNFGQTAAISAGVDAARGAVIVTMDADGQNDPADIPRMTALLGEGYDVVSGWRLMRKDRWLTRRLPSNLANVITRYVTGVPLHDFGCTLKAYDRKVFDEVKLYGEMHRFIPALASWMGAEVTEVKVNHRPRTTGRSKYGLDRILRVSLDLLTVKFLLSWAARPIQVFGKMGLACFLGAAFTGLYVLYDKIFHHHNMVRDPLLAATVLLLIIGTQFISLGLLGELQIRTYHEAQNKPVYYVRETIG